MSDILLDKDGIDPQVTELATRIRSAQAPEIETMTAWLESWGEPLEAAGMAQRATTWKAQRNQPMPRA